MCLLGVCIEHPVYCCRGHLWEYFILYHYRIRICAPPCARQEFLLHPDVIDHDAGGTGTDYSSLY